MNDDSGIIFLIEILAWNWRIVKLFIIQFRWVLNPLIFAAQNQKKPINVFLKILTSNYFNQGENTFNSSI